MSPTFLWVSKFHVKLGVGDPYFRNYHMYVSFQIFGSKIVIFFYFLIKFIRFIAIFKNVICNVELKKVLFQTCHLLFVFYLMGSGGTVIKSVLQFSLYVVGIKIMYMSTYIRNKRCHQHSYVFQNFMSSWGSWSKISKLQQVGDFSFFGSKS